MDWKYKHFRQARVFPAERDVVSNAARAFMTESLGWKIAETTDGFSAEGYSFSHRAIADVRIHASADGTTVEIELLVARAGATGFMLFDVGGYYNIQIRKWFDGIQLLIHRELSDDQNAAPIPPHAPPSKAASCLFNGCLGFIVVMFGLWLVINVGCAVIGLITGHLVLLGRHDNIHVEGIAARVVSAIILLFGAWIGWRIIRFRSSVTRR